MAHVKWFSDFSFAEPPRSVSELLGPTFIGLLLLSVVVVGALVPVERWLGERPWYTRVNAWLESRADSSRLVMRIGAGMVLLLAWQADIVLIPDLPLPTPWVGWFQFLLVGLLLGASLPFLFAGLTMYAVARAEMAIGQNAYTSLFYFLSTIPWLLAIVGIANLSSMACVRC